MLKNKSISTANPVIYFQVGFFFLQSLPPTKKNKNKIKYGIIKTNVLTSREFKDLFFGVGGELIPLELDPTMGINLHIGD